MGGANPQAGLGFLVQLPNGECRHVSNDSIASIGCKEEPPGMEHSEHPHPLENQMPKGAPPAVFVEDGLQPSPILSA